MIAEDEHQRVQSAREPEPPPGERGAIGIKLRILPIISGHQRSSAVSTELSRQRPGEESSTSLACGRPSGFFAKPQNHKPRVHWQPRPQCCACPRQERNRARAGREWHFGFGGVLSREASNTPTHHWCSFEPVWQPGAGGRASVSGGESAQAVPTPF